MEKDSRREWDKVDLYSSLVAEMMKDTKASEEKMNELLTSKQYREDYEYRIIVDTVNVFFFYIQGKPREMISLATDIIERGMSLNLWYLVAMNHNLLGTAYQMLEILEKALESYRIAIETEKEYGIVSASPLAYNNIALLYLNLEEYQRAYDNIVAAINLEKKSNRDEKARSIKLATYNCHLVIVLCYMKRVREANEILNDVIEMYPEIMESDESYFYEVAKLHYAFRVEEYEEARKIYHHVKKKAEQKNRLWLEVIVGEFFTLCKEMKLGYDLYMDEWNEVLETYVEDEIIDIFIYEALWEYCKEIGDKEKFDNMTFVYIRALEKNEKSKRKRQLESLKMVEDLLDRSKMLTRIQSKNKELQMMVEEAVKTKKNLQEVNSKLKFISDIGRKMTSSLEVSKVIGTIYENLSRSLAIDSFVIMVAEPEKNRLRALSYYDHQVLQPSFEICLDNPDSVFAKCFKVGEMIISKDIYDDERFDMMRPIFIGEGDIHSVIYMPLKVEENLMGVFSIQSVEIGAYEEKDVELLDMFIPYISIGVKNAVYSEKLEEAIRAQLDIQSELEQANSKLERLSSLDGLTQISNRRDFDNRILNLIQKAIKRKSTISVIMIDIDNFKVYNDTYGHLEGDEALKKVAKCLSGILEEEGGISARFGGEEFIGAGADFSREEAERIGQRICDEIRGLEIENRNTEIGYLTVSIGISFSFVKMMEEKSLLMKTADDALYQAKKSGKNRVVLVEI